MTGCEPLCVTRFQVAFIVSAVGRDCLADEALLLMLSLVCVTGIVQDPELRLAVAKMTVECTATDLGPALGTMLLRLFPHLFKVQEPLRKCRTLHGELAALQGVMAGTLSTPAFNASAAGQLDDAARRLERRLRRVIALLESCAAEVPYCPHRSC